MTKVISGNGSLKASYTYDADGIRTSKTVNGNRAVLPSNEKVFGIGASVGVSKTEINMIGKGVTMAWSKISAWVS